MSIFAIFSGIGFNLTTILSATLICIIVHQFYRRDRRNLPPPPGICLPLIGHMHHMGEDMRAPMRKLRQRLGDVYSLQLGARLAIVVSGYKTVKEAFVKNGDLFADRAELFTLEAVVQGKGFVNKSGPEWQEHRRFVLTTMKDLGMGRRILEAKVTTEATRLVHLFRETGAKPFYPRPPTNTVVANVISSMVFGDSFDHGEPLIGEMLGIVEQNMVYAIRAGVLNFLPFLRWLPGDLFKFKTVVSNANKAHAFCNEIVTKHRQASDKDAVDDFTNAYLRALEQKNLSEEETSFSVDNLSGTIADLFFAGSETTTTVLCWSLVCLVEHPDIQQTLYEQIIKHCGESGVVSLDHKSKLTHLEAFYMEVLRLCDITPFMPGHAVSRDTQLNGYTIPKDAIICVDIDSILHDAEIWGDPETFRPDRFLDAEGRLTKNEEFAPFFMGKRSCVGESLARMELFLILGALIREFEFTCPDGETVTYKAVDGSFGLAHAPKPFNVVATPRQ